MGTVWHWAWPLSHWQCSTRLLLTTGRSHDSCRRYVIWVISSLQATTVKWLVSGHNSPNTDALPPVLLSKCLSLYILRPLFLSCCLLEDDKIPNILPPKTPFVVFSVMGPHFKTIYLLKYIF